MKNNHLFLLVLIVMVFGNSYNSSAQNYNWVAPSSSDNLENPFKDNAKATNDGKIIFDQMCVLCHGLQGEGNGEVGLTLEQKPANFLDLRVVNQTDGNIFWKITNGKAPMASYEDLLTDNQRWKLVNYIRELKINKNKK